jgi:signal peptidase II
MKAVSHKRFLQSVVVFAVLLMLDRASKTWVQGLGEALSFSMISFETVFNHGVILGKFAHLPPNIKTTLISTLGAMTLGTYILFLLVIPVSSRWLQMGPVFLVSGIIGNVLDRLIDGSVVDFIGLNILNDQTIFFNLADIFQWIGYISIGIGIKQDADSFWPQNDWRSTVLINKKFQFRCGVFLAIFCFLISSVFIVFGYAFFKQTSDGEFDIFYLTSSGLILLFLSLVSFVLGLHLSHRIAGPIHSLVKYMNESLEGKDAPFILRKNDEFKELQHALSDINEKLNDKSKPN